MLCVLTKLHFIYKLHVTVLNQQYITLIIQIRYFHASSKCGGKVAKITVR